MRHVLFSLMTLSLVAQAPAEAPKAAVAAAPAKPAESKILARIDGKVYRDSDLDAYIASAYNDQQRAQINMIQGARQQIQSQFLQARLLEAKARKEKLDKTAEFATKRSLAEMDVLVRALFDRDGEKLRAQITMKDEEYKAYYEAHKDKFMSPESFTCRHLLVSVKGAPNGGDKGLTEDEAKAKIAKLQADLKAGKKLEELAKESSDDPGSKEKGGLYENINFGSFAPEFEAAVRKQAVGVVGEPVKTAYGYHLIQVEKINPSQLQAYDEVKDKAKGQATQERQEQVMKAYMEAVKKDISYVEGPDAEKAPAKAAGKGKKSGAKK